MTDPMQTEREAFEAWGLREGRMPAGHKLSPGGRYVYSEVQADWECWQAALSSQASELRSLRDALQLAKSRIAELEGEHVRQAPAMAKALEHIIRRLQMDIDDGSRPDQWSMEDLVRTARAALKEKGE